MSQHLYTGMEDTHKQEGVWLADNMNEIWIPYMKREYQQLNCEVWFNITCNTVNEHGHSRILRFLFEMNQIVLLLSDWVIIGTQLSYFPLFPFDTWKSSYTAPL
jgi:hypothetical protein